MNVPSKLLKLVVGCLAFWLALRWSVEGITEFDFVNGEGVPLSAIPPVPHGSKLWLERQEAAWDNPCPFLKTAFVQGLITVDEDGYTPKHEIGDLMDWAGVGHSVFPHPSYLQKWGTPGLPMLHLGLNRPADTRTMRNRPRNQTKKEADALWKELVDQAPEDGNWAIPDVEAEIEHYATKYGPSDQSTVFGMRGEMATMFTVFGHPPGSEKRNWWTGLFSDVLSNDDLEALWQRSEYPKGWREHRRRFSWAPMTNNDLIMVARLMAPGGLVDTGKKNGFEVSKTEDMPSFFAPTISDDAYAKLPKTMSRFDSRVGGDVKGRQTWYRDVWQGEEGPKLWSDQYRECACETGLMCYKPWPFGKGYEFDPLAATGGNATKCPAEQGAAIAKAGWTYVWLVFLVAFAFALAAGPLLDGARRAAEQLKKGDATYALVGCVVFFAASSLPGVVGVPLSRFMVLAGAKCSFDFLLM